MQIAYDKVLHGEDSSALALYLETASWGIEVAQCNVAWMLERGLGLPKGDAAISPKRIERSILYHLRMASAQGSSEAHLRLGDMVFYGELGHQVNYTIAARHYMQATGGVAAVWQMEQAVYNLAYMAEHGFEGSTRNLPRALELYTALHMREGSDSRFPAYFAAMRVQGRIGLLEAIGEGSYNSMTVYIEGWWEMLPDVNLDPIRAFFSEIQDGALESAARLEKEYRAWAGLPVNGDKAMEEYWTGMLSWPVLLPLFGTLFALLWECRRAAMIEEHPEMVHGAHRRPAAIDMGVTDEAAVEEADAEEDEEAVGDELAISQCLSPSLVSMARWVCLVRRIRTICFIRLLARNSYHEYDLLYATPEREATEQERGSGVGWSPPYAPPQQLRDGRGQLLIRAVPTSPHDASGYSPGGSYPSGAYSSYSPTGVPCEHLNHPGYYSGSDGYNTPPHQIHASHSHEEVVCSCCQKKLRGALSQKVAEALTRHSTPGGSPNSGPNSGHGSPMHPQTPYAAPPTLVSYHGTPAHNAWEHD